MSLPWKFVAKLYRQKYHDRLQKIERQREELRKLLKGKTSRKALIRKLFWDSELLLETWIDVKDELPEEGAKCELYCWGGAQFTAQYFENGVFFPLKVNKFKDKKGDKVPSLSVDCDYFVDDGKHLPVTAWRPLSKPPNQDQNMV